jgi:hypothetical protein
VRNLTIIGGGVDAVGTDGANVGAGYGDHRNSQVSALLISDAAATATGTNGAGIGAGYGKTATGSSAVSDLVIKSSVISDIRRRGQRPEALPE